MPAPIMLRMLNGTKEVLIPTVVRMPKSQFTPTQSGGGPWVHCGFSLPMNLLPSSLPIHPTLRIGRGT